MITLLALALCLVGFAALALAMDRHQRQVWQRVRPRGRAPLRLVGVAALCAALAACVAHAGWATGLVLWTGLLSAAALAVALAMSYRPRLFNALFRCGGADAGGAPAAFSCSPALLFGLSVVVLSALVYVGIPPAPELALPGTAIASDSVASGGAATPRSSPLTGSPGASPEPRPAALAEPEATELPTPVQGRPPVANEPPSETDLAAALDAASPTVAEGPDGDSQAARESILGGTGQSTASATPALVRDYVAGLRVRFEASSGYPDPTSRVRRGNTVLVYLVIGRDGDLVDLQLAQGSGDPQLDAAALERVGRARPLPPLPDRLAQDRLALVLPIAVPRTGPAFYPGRPWQGPAVPPSYPQPWRGMPYPGPPDPLR